MEKTIRLNNGRLIPAIGLGTWMVSDGQAAVNTVMHAVESGYRHFDTASMYGNEKGIGRGIRECGIDREELFITTKLWNSDRGYKNTLKALEKSMERLQLDYLDLYLIHWPATAGQYTEWKRINAETWKAMEELHKDGRIHSIGLSNFKPRHMEPLLEGATVLPAVNQVEYHPGCIQAETVAYCKSHNITVEGWAPLGTGRMIENPTLISIARHYNKSVAQVCIRWALQNEVIPLPKSSRPERMKENIAAFDFEISQEDMQIIYKMDNFGSSGQDPDLINF